MGHLAIICNGLIVKTCISSYNHFLSIGSHNIYLNSSFEYSRKIHYWVFLSNLGLSFLRMCIKALHLETLKCMQEMFSPLSELFVEHLHKVELREKG